MVQVFKEKGSPMSNNPDDIPLLQELSRTDAELHLAYAADLFSQGQKTRAAQQWESGCIRLEAYVRDGIARLEVRVAVVLFCFVFSQHSVLQIAMVGSRCQGNST